MTFMVLRGPREPRAGLELGWLQGSPLHDAWTLLLLSPKSFKERKGVHHTKEIMSGLPSFSELEKAKKPLKGKCWPQGCNFQIAFGCPAGTGQSLNPCDTKPAAAAMTPLDKSQAGSRSSLTTTLRKIRGRPEKGRKRRKQQVLLLSFLKCVLLGVFRNYPLGLQMLPLFSHATTSSRFHQQGCSELISVGASRILSSL